MSLTRWLSNRLGSASRPTFRTNALTRRATFRPCFEALEERWVPSTLTVTSSADKGAGSLRADITAAQNGDTIVFTSSLNGRTITLGSELLINKNLTITGPGAGQLTVSGNNTSRVFEVAQGVQLTMSGLTISNGFAVHGAGILVDTGAGLVLSNCTLSGNAATKAQNYVGNFGGGIDNYGTATVSNCTLMNNTSLAGGGGVYNHATLTLNNNSLVSGSSYGGIVNAGMATITGSTLSDNGGSGIYNFWTGTVIVSDSLLSGNFAYGDGGGIYNVGTANLSNCTLSGNYAPVYGGGIYAASNASGSGKLTLSGCTLSGNTTTTTTTNGYGGGIYITGGTAFISGCTLSGNSAAVAGGGIYIWHGTLTITGSTLSGNSARFGGGIYIGSGAVVHLDAFTIASILNNTDSSGLNGHTANIDGSYTAI